MVRCRWRGKSPGPASGFKGWRYAFCRWVQGEPTSPARDPAARRWRHPIRAGLAMGSRGGRRLPRAAMKRPDVSMARVGSMPEPRHKPGGLQREARSGPPLPRCVGTTTHILRNARSVLVLPIRHPSLAFGRPSIKSIESRPDSSIPTTLSACVDRTTVPTFGARRLYRFSADY